MTSNKLVGLAVVEEVEVEVEVRVEVEGEGGGDDFLEISLRRFDHNLIYYFRQ